MTIEAPPTITPREASATSALPTRAVVPVRRARASKRHLRAVLSTAGPIVFLPPALAMADRDVTVFGIPALALYVFSAWLIGIILIALVSRGEPAD